MKTIFMRVLPNAAVLREAGNIVPFTAMMFIKVLQRLAAQHDEKLGAHVLQGMWNIVDQSIMVPGVKCEHCRKKRETDPDVASHFVGAAAYLALHSYFMREGNFAESEKFFRETFRDKRPDIPEELLNEEVNAAAEQFLKSLHSLCDIMEGK